MGKKKITKEPKPVKGKAKEEEAPEPEKVAQPTSAKKKGKKAPKETSDITLFSASFEKRIEEFKNFYQDFLERKAVAESSNLDEELEKVTENVSQKIEEACSEVLKEDLKDAENWIVDQQKALQEQINKINSAYNETKKTLSSTGTFSESEIEQQLQLIEIKKIDLENEYKNYTKLNEQASRIYSNSAIDEEL